MEVISGYALDAMRDRQRLANTIEDPDQKRKAWTWAFRGESRSRLTNIIELARYKPPIADRGQWDQHCDFLGAPNGLIELRTGELRHAHPDERITMCAGIDYDPEARSELWEAALKDIFPHEGLPEFIQLLFGYSITGETKYDKWFMSTGAGRNGKGTVLGPIRFALGDYAVELPAKILDRRQADQYDLATGAKLHEVKDALGHASLTMTDRYLNSTMQGIQEAVNRLPAPPVRKTAKGQLVDITTRKKAV